MAVQRKLFMVIPSLVFVFLLYKLLSHPSFLSVPQVYQKDYKMTPEEVIQWYGYLDGEQPQNNGDDIVIPDADRAREIAFEALAGQGAPANAEGEA